MNALLVLLALQAPPDGGTFVIRQDSIVVARETFELQPIARGRGAGG